MLHERQMLQHNTVVKFKIEKLDEYCQQYFSPEQWERVMQLSADDKIVNDGSGTKRQMVSDKEAKMIVLLSDTTRTPEISKEIQSHLFTKKWTRLIYSGANKQVMSFIGSFGADYEDNIVRGKHLAADIANEVYNRVVFKISEFEGDASFTTWSFEFLDFASKEVLKKHFNRDDVEKWLAIRYEEVKSSQAKIRAGEELKEGLRKKFKKIEAYGESYDELNDEGDASTTIIIDTSSQNPEDILIKNEQKKLFHDLVQSFEEDYSDKSDEKTKRNHLIISIMLKENIKYEVGDGNLVEVEREDIDESKDYYNSKEYQKDKVTYEKIAERYNSINPESPIKWKTAYDTIQIFIKKQRKKRIVSEIKEIIFSNVGTQNLSNFEWNNPKDNIFETIASEYNRRVDVDCANYNRYKDQDKKDRNPNKYYLTSKIVFTYLQDYKKSLTK